MNEIRRASRPKRNLRTAFVADQYKPEIRRATSPVPRIIEYVVLNVSKETHAKVMSLSRIKTHKLSHGEHIKESADSVINRALCVLGGHMKKTCRYCGMVFPTQVETNIHEEWSENRGGCEMTELDLSTCFDCGNYVYLERCGHCCRLSKKILDPYTMVCFRWIPKEEEEED